MKVLNQHIICSRGNLKDQYIRVGTVTPTSLCAGSNFTIPFTSFGLSFTAANTFTAQLSDINGSFTNPVNIGSIVSTGTGSITATLPANISSGTGYRVRIKSLELLTTGLSYYAYADKSYVLTVGQQTFYQDADGDGFGNPAVATTTCPKSAGYVANNTDCNDNAASIHPGVIEICDGIDNDCDGETDEGVKTTFYHDADGDGFGNAAITVQACTVPQGYVNNSTDCNDGNVAVYPGATEICNGIDDNCDGSIDNNGSSGVCDIVLSSSGTCLPGITLNLSNAASASKIEWYRNGTLISTATPQPIITTVAGGNGQGSAANQLNNPAGIFVDAEGNLFVADYINNRVQKWASGASIGITVAGGNGAGPEANQTALPLDVYVDAGGNLYVTDPNFNRIQKWAPGASLGITVAGGNGQGSAANQLISPRGIFVDASGNVFVSDYGHRIQKWPVGATSGITVAGGNGQGSAADQLNSPSGLFVDVAGNIFIADEFNNRVQKWVPGASSGITVAGNLNRPVDVFVDEIGNILIVEFHNQRVQKWIPGATTGITVAGGNGMGSDANQLFNPYSVFVDETGNIFVADQNNQRVQEWAVPSINTNFTPTLPGIYAAVVIKNTGTTTTNPVTINAPVTFYKDEDGDGFGDLNNTTQACVAPDGYVVDNTDCDDLDIAIFPGATEICDGKDNDCDGNIDEDIITPSVSISIESSIVCSNDVSTFTATQLNGGNNPIYYWKKNGFVFQSGTQAIFEIVNLQSGDIITCDMKSNAPCATPQTVNSNSIIMTVTPATVYYRDADNDGYGNSAVTIQACSLPAGYVNNSSDCNDANVAVHPGATEICNGIDDNCNGTIDEAVKTTFYRDADGDGFGDPLMIVNACTPPVGYVLNNTDNCPGINNPDQADTDNDGIGDVCDYSIRINSSLFPFTCPGASFGIQYIATGTFSAGNVFSIELSDASGSFANSVIVGSVASVVSGSITCNLPNDLAAGLGYRIRIVSSAPVVISPDNGTDLEIKPMLTYYRDADGDGFGIASNSLVNCFAITGYVLSSGDCNDNDNTVYPGAAEICDSKDNNCNGQVDEGVQTTYYQDADSDGYGNSLVSTQACSQPEGYVLTGGDCNDNNASVHPNAIEICNGIDDNCDGQIEEGTTLITYYQDSDGDGYGNSLISIQACVQPGGTASIGGDCNDNNSAVHPNAVETCGNGIDENCNGQIDEDCTTLPAISINDIIVYESQAVATITVNLSKASTQAVKINYATLDGTAVSKGKGKSPAIDYIAAKGTLTIPAGSLSGTITITILSDGISESSEFFDLQISLMKNANATIADGTGRVTILDGTPITKMNSSANEREVTQTEDLEIKIWPNPSTSSFTLHFNNRQNEKITVSVHDINGRVLETITYLAPGKTIRLGDKYLPGVYFAKVVQGEKTKVFKLVKF